MDPSFFQQKVDLATVSKIESRGFMSMMKPSLFQQRELIWQQLVI